MIPVKDFAIEKGMTVNSLSEQMLESGGFTSKKLAQGIDILESMIKDKDSFNFLSFPAAIIATGTRGIIRDMVKKGWFDTIITTCGTLDHDIARTFKEYYHGDFMMDDIELGKKGIHRLGNVLVPKESYGIILEKKMLEFLEEIYSEGKNELATHELVWEIGKRIRNKDSIVYWCYKNKIPMIIPGITDGSIGYQIWQFSQDHNFKINVLKDETLMSDIAWKSKKSGALMIGGGISKHHVIWWNAFTKHGGLNYAVFVTTAQEYDGSLSGARTREAISWGKISEKAKHITIEEDATIALPIIFAALIDRIKQK